MKSRRSQKRKKSRGRSETRQDQRNQIPRSRKIFYGLLVAVVFFAVCECLARVMPLSSPKMPTVGQRRFVTWLSDLSVTDPSSGPLYQTDERLLWKLVPSTRIDTINQHHADGGEEQQIQISINDRGYRGPLPHTGGTGVSRRTRLSSTR